jgi:thiamine pyrophosphokinase
MEALLISGGDAPPRARLAGRFDDFGLVCAADSGLDIAREWGLVPDIIVGDMDSVSDPGLVELYPSARVIRAPRDKDESDTELGLKALAGEGADGIVLAGGGGGRLDHLLAVRALFERALRPVEWHTRFEVVYLLCSGASLELGVERGATISVFPLSGGARGMSSLGLLWPLDGLAWGPGDFGLSNRASEGRILISAGEGDLLVLILDRAFA